MRILKGHILRRHQVTNKIVSQTELVLCHFQPYDIMGLTLGGKYISCALSESLYNSWPRAQRPSPLRKQKRKPQWKQLCRMFVR